MPSLTKLADQASPAQESQTQRRPAPEPQEVALAKVELARRELARRDLAEFVYRYGDTLGAREMKRGWFHRVLADTMKQFIEDVLAGKRPRLIIEAPPRHSKSLFVTRAFIPWMLASYPRLSALVSCSTQRLCDDFGRDIRNVMGSPDYLAAYPHAKPESDSQSMDALRTVSGGKYRLISAGSAIPGFGADILIGDDIVGGREIADSATEMERLWSWFNGDFMNRVSPGGGVIIMNTRWSETDIAGRVIAADKAGRWQRLSFPAIAEEDDQWRKAGEALQPEWYPLAALEDERDRLMSVGKEREWLALFQQRPTAIGGNYFTENLFSYTEVFPGPDTPDVVWHLGIDLAASTKDTADKSAIVPVGALADGSFCLGAEAQTGRWTPRETTIRILDAAEKYRVQAIYGEKGPLDAAFRTLLQEEMGRRKRYFAIVGEHRKVDKWNHAAPLHGHLASGKVKLPAVPFYRLTFVPQFLSFRPSASKQEDGLIDATANVFASLNKVARHAATPSAAPARTPAQEDEEMWRRIQANTPSAILASNAPGGLCGLVGMKPLRTATN